MGSDPAVVVLAHDKPNHLHRLLAALDPLPVFLHIDAGTSAGLHEAMTTRLPDRVRLLPRLRTGWGRLDLVRAELEGYRAALAHTDAGHVALVTGADYPLASTGAIRERLAAHPACTFLDVHRLPYKYWGAFGGYERFVLRHSIRRGRRIASPLPRRWPRDLRPTGGSQLKILARGDAAALLSVMDTRPDLWAYFAGVWIPDETVVPSLLCSPRLGMHTRFAQSPPLWHIGWPKAATPSPDWLDSADLPGLVAAASAPDGALFARKFGDEADELVGLIDRELRGAS